MKRKEEEEEQFIVAISVVPKLGLESPILGDLVQEKKVDIKKRIGGIKSHLRIKKKIRNKRKSIAPANPIFLNRGQQCS